MDLRGIIQKIRHRIEDEKHWLTRQKLAVFGATLIVIGVSMGAFESARVPPDTTAFTEIVELKLPEHLPIKAVNPGSEVRVVEPWDAVVVRSGQTLLSFVSAVRR